MDQITIKDLEVYANHGLYKEEKALGQKFLVSAILSLDTKLAGVSDQGFLALPEEVLEEVVQHGKTNFCLKDCEVSILLKGTYTK